MVAINPEMAQGRLASASAVIAVSYVFVIVTLLFTVLRISLALLRRRKFGVDDGSLIAAVVFGLTSAICIGNAVMNGLGRSVALVHSGQLAQYFKLSYWSLIMMLLAMTASKISVIALIQRLTPQNAPCQRYVRWLYPVVGSWAIFSVFGVAFQCGVPAPWLYSPAKCTGQGAIWYPIAVWGMITDIVLALGFVPVLKDIQADATKKNKVTGLFLSRLIVPAFAIVHIALLAPALHSEDQTLVMSMPSMFAQITMNLSILTAAVPALSRTLVDLETIAPTRVVSGITPVAFDASHSRGTSDENNKLRDWAFAQLRNSPTPNSLILISDADLERAPKKPEDAHLGLEKVDTAPPVPLRSERRAVSPQLTLNLPQNSSHLDVKEAWFVDSKRTSSTTEDTIDETKRFSQ